MVPTGLLFSKFWLAMILRFKNSKTVALYCHLMDINMAMLPFFQLFGTDVSTVDVILAIKLYNTIHN